MTSESTSGKNNLWPLLVIGIGLAFIGVTGWSIIQAREKVSPITDPAYYSHGLRYSQTALEEKAAESSGWVMRTELAGHRLNILLENGNKQTVGGCRGVLVLYDNVTSQPARRLELTILEEKSGVYFLELPAKLSGALTGDLSLHRDGARFNRRLLINL
jgi:hypothetical protein